MVAGVVLASGEIWGDMGRYGEIWGDMVAGVVLASGERVLAD